MGLNLTEQLQEWSNLMPAAFLPERIKVIKAECSRVISIYDVRAALN